MAINKAEQGLEDQLINRVKALEDQILFMKTHPQKVGADILDVTYVGGFAGPITIAAGNALTLLISVTPLFDFVLTLYNLEFSLYVDVFDSNHQYSDGASLTTAQRSLSLENWLDYEHSDEVSTFIRGFKIRMKNTDVSTHDYYIRFIAIGPRLSRGTS